VTATERRLVRLIYRLLLVLLSDSGGDSNTQLMRSLQREMKEEFVAELKGLT